MRDVKRIRPLLNRLAAVWESMPDMRLGQLIENAVGTMGDTKLQTFYVEDEPLLHAAEALARSTCWVPISKPLTIALRASGAQSDMWWGAVITLKHTVVWEDQVLRPLQEAIAEANAQLFKLTAGNST